MCAIFDYSYKKIIVMKLYPQSKTDECIYWFVFLQSIIYSTMWLLWFGIVAYVLELND